jgi:hypothetical protein
MVYLGRWASFPALDPVDPDSHSCSRIAANTTDGTLLKDLKGGCIRNKHTHKLGIFDTYLLHGAESFLSS